MHTYKDIFEAAVNKFELCYRLKQIHIVLPMLQVLELLQAILGYVRQNL